MRSPTDLKDVYDACLEDREARWCVLLDEALERIDETTLARWLCVGVPSRDGGRGMSIGLRASFGMSQKG